ncbi:uncharacterized protein EI90DRAFT_3053702, partial [Cantharellus anzutake]|uniref:uncharacterized protein n=1 Tax=Cantharellus anzutake TaxID=1750568 RepID=UPI001902DE0E
MFDGLTQIIYQNDLRFVLLCNEFEGSWCIELGLVFGEERRWWKHVPRKGATQTQVHTDDIVTGIIAGELFVAGWNGSHSDSLVLSILPSGPRPINLTLEEYSREESKSKAEELLFQIAVKAGRHGCRLWHVDSDGTKRENVQAEEVVKLRAEAAKTEETLSIYKDQVKRLEGDLLRYGPPPKQSNVKKLVQMPKRVTKGKSGLVRMDFTSGSDDGAAPVPQKRVAPSTSPKVSPDSKRARAGPSRKTQASKDFETDT